MPYVLFLVVIALGARVWRRQAKPPRPRPQPRLMNMTAQDQDQDQGQDIEPCPFIWLSFPDGAIFQLRQAGSGITLKSDWTPVDLNQAVSVLSAQARLLFSRPAEGIC